MPISEPVKRERNKLLNDFNGFREIEEFEKNVKLAPFDLTDTFHDI